jgi:hypothetical protein
VFFFAPLATSLVVVEEVTEGESTVIGVAEAVVFGGARLKMEMRREYNGVKNKEKRGVTRK